MLPGLAGFDKKTLEWPIVEFRRSGDVGNRLLVLAGGDGGEVIPFQKFLNELESKQAARLTVPAELDNYFASGGTHGLIVDEK